MLRLATAPPATPWLRPAFGLEGRSTQALLGVIGYAIASIFVAVLAGIWELSLVERAIALLAPPVVFLALVTAKSRLSGRDWIVLFPIAWTAVALVAALAFVLDLALGRMLDVVVLGIAVFVALGRVGCLHRGCCHGVLARRGIVYGQEHVGLGIWPRFAGRRVLPVQAVEAAGTLALAIVAVLLDDTPGTAAVVVASGYAVLRFAVELGRGDIDRRFLAGLSDGQWGCLATAAVCAAVRPSIGTLASLGVLVVAATHLVVMRHRSELVAPAHLAELDELIDDVMLDSRRRARTTRAGVTIACRALDDGRIAWTFTASHRAWSEATARRIASTLWEAARVTPGPAPGSFEVLVTPRWVTT
ncbi:MAG TPA: prolipoprotein diacylglyceryl transferase family protein [Kofleriaceae bacterium]|nr:prolipoprotein diacylglyceryl transferase family protein [Kofleriaceae bacterium]